MADYRCFLSDLAGFTDPQSLGPDHHFVRMAWFCTTVNL